MTYTISIYDINEKPIPAASVSFTSAAGELLGVLIADSAGVVTFDDTAHPNWVFDGTTISAEAGGYYPASISAPSITENWFFRLMEKPNTLAYVLGGIGLGIFAYRLWAHLRKK
jgi:hypothetical protein